MDYLTSVSIFGAMRKISYTLNGDAAYTMTLITIVNNLTIYNGKTKILFGIFKPPNQKNVTL